MKKQLVFLAILTACGGREDIQLGGDGGNQTDVDAGAPVIPGLVSLSVTPASQTVVVDDVATPEQVAYTATGTFMDGSSRDVTAEVGWGVDNDAPGHFTGGGTWTSSNRAGGAVIVEARAGQIAATAELEVFLDLQVDDGSAPPGAPGLFDPATPVVTGDAAGPRIVYPAHEVMFPVNVYRVLFQYDAPAALDVYRVRFTSPHLDLEVFTTADRWLADEDTWSFLARTNAGEKVVMTVAGVASAAPSTIYESTPIDVYFSRSAVEGAIYYWSTSSEGVMKGLISQAEPQKFYTQPPDNKCVACHTLSRDGKKMAVGYDGETLQEIAVPGRDVIIPTTPAIPMGWSTFSPDATRLLVANKGVLTLLDADSGARVGDNSGVVPTGGVLVTHPDWSPLGDYVAVAACTTATNNKDVQSCSIARIPYDNGVWGELETLVPAAGQNHFFPKYSPDGRWIAYVTATGKSKDQPTSELWLVDAEGGTPVALVRGNHRVGPADGVTGIANTMPTWAPSTHAGTQWLAFSSIRSYGQEAVGLDQLWVVAIDLSVGAGEDPSYAAFWLPLQDQAERNHRAFWTHDADQPCEATSEVCDEFDNDCDGVVDEDCADCSDAETCGDGLDNDCDGEVDEGCIG